MVKKQECEEAINEICKKCYEKHELEYGCQPVNCAFRAFDNEDCPTVMVLKKLIQEHFEERQETNLEHYYNDILKLNGSFSLINGKIGICQGICCSRCAFNKDYCQVGRMEWLKQPYKKPTYKLSQFEYDLINAFDSCKECCLLNEIECLKKLREKGYFKGIDPFTKVHEIIDNCEVIK